MIAGDPTDAQVLYGAFDAGPYGGESTLMRSADGGRTWRVTGAGLVGERVLALAVDPALPARVFAVAGRQTGANAHSGGVYVSEDSGKHWQRRWSIAAEATIGLRSSVLVTPTAILVGTTAGVSRSTDHGETWQAFDLGAFPDGIHTLLRGSSAAHPIYAAGWQQRLWSADDGASWDPLPDAFPAAGHPWVTALAIAPSDAAVLYEVSSEGDVARSEDGGADWQLLPKPADLSPDIFTSPLLVDPRDPHTVFAPGGRGLMRSRDGGLSFHAVRRGLPRFGDGANGAARLTDLAVDAAGRILAAAQSGVWTSADAGYHWSGLAMRGVHGNPIRFLQADEQPPGALLFASFAAPYATRAGGTDVTRLAPLPAGDLIDLGLDRADVARRVAVTSAYDATRTLRRLFESADSGGHWSQVPALPASPLAAAATPQGGLLLAAGNRIYARPGTGGGWHKTAQVAPSTDRGAFTFERFRVHPRDATTVIAVGREYILHGGDFPVLFASVDAGEHWRRLAAPLSYLAPGVVAFDPRDPSVFYSASGANIVRIGLQRPSQRVLGAVPTGDGPVDLVVDRSEPGTFYAATGAHGVLVSRDGGRSWGPIGARVPRARDRITALVQDADDPPRLYLTLARGGLWRFDPPEP